MAYDLGMPDLHPFHIGPIRVDLPVVLAPLAGYTDLPYRLICRRLGARYCTTEMMLDKMVLLVGRLRSRMMAMTDEDHPLAGQLIGNDPDEMARAAVILRQYGFDAVDLNFACPVRKALSRKRGGYMMTQVELVSRIVRAVLAAVGDRPVTLKIRQQFNRPDDTTASHAIAEEAFAAGAAAVCLHARSVEAKYAGKADWAFLAAFKQRHPHRAVIGSGDVLTPAAALRMFEQTGVDGVSVARGVLGNPWFFRQVQDLASGREPYHPSLAEQRKLMEGHLVDACKLYGNDKGPKIMRKFGIKYARLHPKPKDVRVAFVAVKKPADWTAVLDRFYPPTEDGRSTPKETAHE